MIRAITLTLVVGILLVAGLPGAGKSLAAPSPRVPAEYADLYSALEGRLRQAGDYVSARWNGQRHDVVFSAELLAANSNQGESLLRDQAWPALLFNLDRLPALGVRGVEVAVKYPILVSGFPRSEEYRDLYGRLGQELRRRNLKWLAQMTPGFREPAFSSLPVAGHYAGLTLDRYRREKRQMAETIIREIRPDYLQLTGTGQAFQWLITTGP